MAYRMPCNEPDFRQSVPPGRWSRVADPQFVGQYRYQNDDTGETVLVPAIWYNGTPKEYAAYLTYCAERAEDGALRIEAEGKPWSVSQAAAQRADAARVRALAAVYEGSSASVAGHVVKPRP
jgi:hypothetical protein